MSKKAERCCCCCYSNNKQICCCFKILLTRVHTQTHQHTHTMNSIQRIPSINQGTGKKKGKKKSRSIITENEKVDGWMLTIINDDEKCKRMLLYLFKLYFTLH